MFACFYVLVLVRVLNYLPLSTFLLELRVWVHVVMALFCSLDCTLLFVCLDLCCCLIWFRWLDCTFSFDFVLDLNVVWCAVICVCLFATCLGFLG